MYFFYWLGFANSLTKTSMSFPIVEVHVFIGGNEDNIEEQKKHMWVYKQLIKDHKCPKLRQ